MSRQERDREHIWAIILGCVLKDRRAKLLWETRRTRCGSVVSKPYGVTFPFSLGSVQLEAVSFRSDLYEQKVSWRVAVGTIRGGNMAQGDTLEEFGPPGQEKTRSGGDLCLILRGRGA